MCAALCSASIYIVRRSVGMPSRTSNARSIWITGPKLGLECVNPPSVIPNPNQATSMQAPLQRIELGFQKPTELGLARVKQPPKVQRAAGPSTATPASSCQRAREAAGRLADVLSAVRGA